jgi:hypothetical protein
MAKVGILRHIFLVCKFRPAFFPESKIATFAPLFQKKHLIE